MVTINYKGRTANKFIQYTVGHYIAKKYNLKLLAELEWDDKSVMFNEIQYGSIGNNLIVIDDENWSDIITSDKEFDSPHFHLDGFFNDRNFFESFEEDIKLNMSIEYDDTISPDDVFVHYRMGDIKDTRIMLPIEYYYESLDRLKFDRGFISSDSLEHSFCQKLIDKYNLTPVYLTPTKTISYGKNFNKLVLSEGSFSWSMGFLSKAKEIICSGRHSGGRDFIWHGDLFFNKWDKLYWDYDPSTVYGRYQLNGYKPIRLDENSLVFTNLDGTIRIEKKI